MIKHHSILGKLNVALQEWLSFAVLTQAGSAFDGNTHQFYQQVAKDFTRYGVEKRRM
ncbi:hypothetical protein [Tatumella saanichensis]|uniref:hypothetical protein n=1 Tax=Tatumella saanichensis TaxID=480813 RepID=UPI0004B6FBEC|nr:hypothetical protein [Tatumella saanichensis]